MESKNITPMLKQYFSIKKDHPDSILFFRMGDFYEMFFDDARIAAPILEVVLTSRNKNKKDSVPLCGVPYHARDNYVAKLLKRGFKVAICEQVEDPLLAKGIVKREVTRILTPATALEIDVLSSELNSFIVSIYKNEHSVAMASIDLSVSECEVRSFDSTDMDSFLNEFYRKSPREIVISEDNRSEMDKIVEKFPDISDVLINDMKEYEFNYLECEDILKKQFGIKTIEGLGLKGYESAVIASGALIKYLKSVRKTPLKNISSLRFIPDQQYLILDSTSFKNLEIVKNLRTESSKGSLFAAVDFTVTPMGKRLLKKWISYPLINKTEIDKRLDGIDELLQNLITRSEVRKILKHFGDLAKMNSKISLNVALPSQLLVLKDTLAKIPKILEEIDILKAPISKAISKKLDPLSSVVKLIDKSIADDPSNNLNDGNYIKKGFNKNQTTKNRESIGEFDVPSSP